MTSSVSSGRRSTSSTGAGRSPSAVRVFDPDAASRRLRDRRHGPRDEHRRLAVPRRLRARGAARARARRPPPPAPGDRHDPRRGRPDRAGDVRARRDPPRVGDALRARSAAHRRASARTSQRRVTTILRDVRLVVRDFEPMQERVRHMIELARAAAVRYSPQEVGETVDFLDWLVQLELRVARLPRVRAGRRRRRRRAAIRAVPGSGLGILSDVKRSTFADATPLVDSTTRSAPGSRTATCWSSRRRTRTPRCTGARGWTTSACAS